MFIAFEGLDGSGSSTQSRILAAKLEVYGHAVLQTKEPTNNTHRQTDTRDTTAQVGMLVCRVTIAFQCGQGGAPEK